MFQQNSTLEPKILASIPGQLACHGPARGATNFTCLTRLTLDCNLGYFVTWSPQPRGKTTPIAKRVARMILRDFYHWLVAVGEAKGDPYAALDMLKVRQSNFQNMQGDTTFTIRLTSLPKESSLVA
jgi:hypothetical protein